VLKKAKTPKNPGHYQRITITSIVGKIVETQMVKESRSILDPAQSRLTFHTLDMIQIDGMPASLVADRVNTILTESALEACPPPPKRKRNTKYRWQASFKPYAQKISTTYKTLSMLKPNDRPNSPQLLAFRTAKKLLRQAQRQAAARRRKDIKQAIIDACHKKGKEGFHKLVNDQRRSAVRSTNMDFGQHTDPHSQADSWASYFKDLATPKNDAHFDNVYHRHLQVSYLLQSRLAGGTPLSSVTPETMRTLKNGKSPAIVDILCHLTNACLLACLLVEIPPF